MTPLEVSRDCIETLRFHISPTGYTLFVTGRNVQRLLRAAFKGDTDFMVNILREEEISSEEANWVVENCFGVV